MLTPEQRPTLTISESGVVLTETHDGNEVPADYSFAIVNDYVHAHGRHFEELQYLALGMASHIDAQAARIAELEQDAARYRWLREQASIIRATEGNIKWEWESGEYGEPDHSLDRFIDAAMQSTWPEDISDYGSRIAAIGQNGNDGLHYGQEQEGGEDGSA